MSAAEAITPPLAPRRTRVASVKRAVAMLLLPASFLPVVFLGPSLLRSPRHLWQQTYGDVHRLLWPLGQRHGPLPPTLAPVEGRHDSPAVRRGGTVSLPAQRTPR